MKNPLNDKDFLKQLDLVKKKVTYIKIQSLTFDEQVRESIEGKVISGSINIDGDSAVRRTCSLSMIAQDINLNDYFWTINTKIKILIGIENTINSEYENIIWFNQGIFVLTNFSVTYNPNGYTINLSGQDKMCLLNGSIGGALPASIDFKQEVINTKKYEKVDFGPKFIPDLYQIENEYIMLLDYSNSFSSSETYYKRVYQDFEEVDIDEKTFKKEMEENQKYYYIKNNNIFLDYRYYPDFQSYNMNSKMIIDYCIKNDIYLYTKDDSDIYYAIDFTNVEIFEFDPNENYYVNQEFILNNSAYMFNEFQHYYIKNETTKRMEEIILDEDSYLKQDKLYISNQFVKAIYFDEEQDYYDITPGYYEKTSLNRLSYKTNTYFYKKILTYLPAEENFDPKIEYYDMDGNKVDFLEKVYSQYKSNKYYIKDIYSINYVLYSGEYDPALDYYEEKIYTDKEDVPIKLIIKEAVHTYGREPYYNIIINDVDDEGLLLKEYVGEEPLYLLVNNGICENIANGSQECYLINGNVDQSVISLYTDLMQSELDLLNKKYTSGMINSSDYAETKNNIIRVLLQGLDATKTTIDDKDMIRYNSFIEDFDKNPSKIFFITDNLRDIKIYTVLKLEKGDAAGYEITDLTYPYDLISSPGEALTSILDKIKDTLSNFEYFYDVDGHFVFQRKKTYLNTSWNNIISSEDQTYVSSAADTSAVQYTFEDNDLIISIGNNIKLDNLKNDYSVWGNRKTINGTEVPIHARFAIDQKPYAYVTFPKTKYDYSEETDVIQIQRINGLNYLCQEIYVNKDFVYEILNIDYELEEEEEQEFNYDKVRINPTLYQGNMYAGIYYTYIFCDWREIIYQMALDYYKHNQENDFLANLASYNTFDVTIEYDEGNNFMNQIAQNNGFLYPTGVTGYEQYYEDVQAFWRELYDPNPKVDIGYTGGYYVNKDWQELVEDYSNFNCDYYLPMSSYDDYIKMIDRAIENIQNKIKKLNEQFEYNEDVELSSLIDDIDDLNKKLKALKEEKNRLLRSYYTQELFVFNNSEYREMQKEYNEIEKNKENLIHDTEVQIMSILKDSFELY